MKKYFLVSLIAASTLFVCCSSDESKSSNNETTNGENEDDVETTSEPNILLIIADDMGLDATPGYDFGTQKPKMPTLQKFIDNGIRFTSVWSNPTCTPTRGTILTGKYGFRTNVTKVGDEMPITETSLQSYIETQLPSTYSQSVIGKWHLSFDEGHPTDMNVPNYAGLLRGAPSAYDDWNFTENGTTTNSSEYITTKFTDLAIDWVADQTKPWFLWLAYTAPHTPFHLPPANLLSNETIANNDDSSMSYYLAMLESMDTEMNRLLESIPEAELENTVIIFIGDNGTPGQVLQDYPNGRGKDTLYEGGINVPMVITGKNVARVNEVEKALINTTDLFATIAEIAGVGVSNINDSISFKNLLTTTGSNSREYAYAELGSDTGGSDYTIRNATHKYILFEDGTEAMYNLAVDALEATNLLLGTLSTEDTETKEMLLTALSNLRGE